MELCNKALNNRFFELVKNTKKSIKLCSPFVKKSVIEKIYSEKYPETSVSLITNMNLMNFYRQASDISALKIINSKKGTIYNFQRLHAKIYIFDDNISIITSANLTQSGLSKNYEYGILVDEKQVVKQICSDYASICNNEDTSKITINIIDNIEKYLSELPNNDEFKNLMLIFDKDDQYNPVIQRTLIENNLKLSNWRKVLFNALNTFNKQTFTKTDYIKLIPTLQHEYPQNNHIEAKIRQVLQQLRDIGLIKFEGEGVYTKLWK